MYFAQYIRMLYYCIEPEEHMIQFTENFLKKAVKKGKLDNYSTESYKKFFGGIGKGSGKNREIFGDHIGHCAKNICNEICKDELQKYLQDLMFEEIIEQACEGFKDYIPDINAGNCIEKLVDLFQIVIKNAAKKKDNKPASDDIYELASIPENILKEINKTINDVLTTMEMLKSVGCQVADWVVLTSKQQPPEMCPEWNEFQKRFQVYQEQNSRLRVYFQKYECELFKSASPFSQQLTQKNFLSCSSQVVLSLLDAMPVSKYMVALECISIELEQYLA